MPLGALSPPSQAGSGRRPHPASPGATPTTARSTKSGVRATQLPAAQRAPLVDRRGLAGGGEVVCLDVEVVRGFGAPEARVAIEPALRVVPSGLYQRLDVGLVEQQEA